MGEIIDMRQYKLNKLLKEARAKGLPLETGRVTQARRLTALTESMSRHPAGKGR